MSTTRGLWYKIALVAVAINVAGGIFASLRNESMHAFVHGVLIVGFGIWAWNLRRGRVQEERRIESADRVGMLQDNVSELERELQETRERLEFADQLLKKKPPAT